MTWLYINIYSCTVTDKKIIKGLIIYLNILFYNPVSECFYLFLTSKIWDKFANETQNLWIWYR